MKTQSDKIYTVLSAVFLLPLLLTFALLISSCSVDVAPVDYSDMETMLVNPEFDYGMAEPVLVEIRALDQADMPLQGVRVSVFKDPFNDQGLSGEAMFTGMTGVDGLYSVVVQVPQILDAIYIQADLFGSANQVEVPISAGLATYSFGGFVPEDPDSSSENMLNHFKNRSAIFEANVDYSFMGDGEGDWNDEGVPRYKNRGRIRYDNDFLEGINEAIPEGEEVNDNLLADEDQAVLLLNGDAEVTVAFVHEGAGYRNALGYYTFDPDDPPTSVDDIDEHIIIFPNVSYRDDGGDLRSGHNVTLDDFNSNRGIGWFLVANGWNGETVGEGYGIFYSHPGLNPENNADLRRHLVFFRDDDNETLILGFEDIQRDNNGDHPYYPDHDFNDVIFAITLDSWDALNGDDMVPLPVPGQDADNDGVPDGQDDYPDDAERAFNNYYPGEHTHGYLAFEDKWPTKGDYDFNDLVVSYQINQITNADGDVKQIVAVYDIKAVGAGYRNGFAFELPVPPGQVESVTGSVINDDYLRIHQNSGVELNQRKAVIPVFDNAWMIVQPEAGDEFVNTERGASQLDVDPITITVTLRNPQNWNVWVDQVVYAAPPYNPFLIVNRNRGREVHLPDYPPTALADRELFGTGHDNSHFGFQRFYKTDSNLPWALHMPTTWLHPVEKTQITATYNHFAQWAEADGEQHQNWYLDEGDNIGMDNIWQPPRR